MTDEQLLARLDAIAFGGDTDRHELLSLTSEARLRAYSPLLDFGNAQITVSQRRARDSNPQPVARHLISSQTANHSHTLQTGVSGATGPKTGPSPRELLPEDLLKIIAAWERLPVHIRAAIKPNKGACRGSFF